MSRFLSDTKTNARIAVYDARLKMVEEAEAKGYDTSIWEVKTWKAKLKSLRGEDPKQEDSKVASPMDMIVEVAQSLAQAMGANSSGNEGETE